MVLNLVLFLKFALLQQNYTTFWISVQYLIYASKTGLNDWIILGFYDTTGIE